MSPSAPPFLLKAFVYLQSVLEGEAGFDDGFEACFFRARVADLGCCAEAVTAGWVFSKKSFAESSPYFIE
ncbi:MAG: hypothetical protein WHS46_08160 [Desulfosoma sp.]